MEKHMKKELQKDPKNKTKKLINSPKQEFI